jgi:hypothetical protein
VRDECARARSAKNRREGGGTVLRERDRESRELGEREWERDRERDREEEREREKERKRDP